MLCLVIFILSLCGCQKISTNNQPEVPVEKVTIKMTHCWSEKEVIEQIVANYENENPAVKIEIEYLPVEQYLTTLINQSAAGELPDVFLGWPGSSMEWFYNNNLIEDLSKEAWVSRLEEKALKEATYKGKVGIIPLNKTFICIGYNKSIFQKIGLQIPKNYDDFYKLCNLLKANNVLPIALGSRDSSGYIYTSWLMAASEIYSYDQNYDDKLYAGTTKMNDEKWRTILRRQYEWIEEGFVNRNHLAVDRLSSGLDEFVNEDAAMFILGSWEIDNILERIDSSNQKFEMGFFPMPSTTDSGILVCASGEGLCVNANSANKEETIRFINYFAREDVNQLFNSKMNSFSTYTDVSTKLNPILSEISKFVDKQKTWGYVDAAWPRKIGDTFSKLFPEYLSDKIDENEFLDELDQLWSEER